jgi:hypothetical protein
MSSDRFSFLAETDFRFEATTASSASISSNLEWARAM